jgi:hypothetical protein
MASRRWASCGCVGCRTAGGLGVLMDGVLVLLPRLVWINQAKGQATFLEIAADGEFDGVETLGGEGVRLANDGEKVDALGEIANDTKLALGERRTCPARFGIVVVVGELGRCGCKGGACIRGPAGPCGDWTGMGSGGGSDGGDSGWGTMVAGSVRDDYIGI